MKNNKGISLVALVVVIIILVILSSIAITAGMNDYDKAQQAKENLERSQVIEAVSTRYNNYLRNSTANPLVGDKVPDDYQTEEEIKEYLIGLFQSESRISNSPEKYATFEKELDAFVEENVKLMKYTRVLRHDDIVSLNVDNVSISAVFLVNYYTSSVIGPVN
jgi:Tfp pilus assembly protein PilE